MRPRHCPSCAAVIPEPSSAGATCPYCGTESHDRARHIADDAEIPSPTELPDGPEPGTDPSQWTFEQWIGALLREPAGDRRTELAERMPAFDESALVWAPALADLMLADATLDRPLGDALGRLAGTWNSVALRGQVMRVVKARLPRLYRSRGVLAALEGVGVAALKMLLELADQADRAGDPERVLEVLNPVRGVVDRQTDEVAAACMETLLELLPRSAVATRGWVIHYVADCVDSRYEVALPGPRSGREFRFLIPLVARFCDEHAPRDPDLVAELVDEIARLHTFHSKSLTDSQHWRRATSLPRTAEGRAVVEALVERLYPGDSAFAVERADEVDIARREVSGEVVAEVVDGRARCPACGAPVRIRGAETVVACERCARPVRIPLGVRTDLEGRSFEDEIEHWSEVELVGALRREADVPRRLLIAAEIDSARTHGSRYVALVGDLVDQMLEDAEERVVIDLESALTRMIESGGDAFRVAILDAVRSRPHARRQVRLVRVLGACGADAFELLLSMGRAAFAESTARAEAASEGAAAFEAAAEALRRSGFASKLVDRLLAEVEAMPGDASDQGAWLFGEHCTAGIGRLFSSYEHSTGDVAPLRDRVLEFLDERIDPTGTTYSGMAPRPGCALFYTVGGLPGLGRLAGAIESAWDEPFEASDLRRRLRWLKDARTDEVKLLVLCSLRERGGELRDADVRAAEEAIGGLTDHPDLGATATAALAVVRGESPGEEPVAEFPTTRIGLWWFAWKVKLRGLLARRR